MKNKYYKWYHNICSKASQEKRTPDTTLYESHHILPKSLGGSDETDNLVLLTFKEHYLAHLLLTRFTVGKDKMKMCFALHTFFHFQGKNKHRPLVVRSAVYEAHKKWYIEACKNRTQNFARQIYRFKHQKTGEELIGTRHDLQKHAGLTSQETYNIISENNRLRHSKGWGYYIEERNMYSYELPTAHNGANMPSKTCPHCNKLVTLGNYSRWHGDKCKIIDPRGHKRRSEQVASINRLS